MGRFLAENERQMRSEDHVKEIVNSSITKIENELKNIINCDNKLMSIVEFIKEIECFTTCEQLGKQKQSKID